MAMNVKTRNISLTPEIDAFVAGQVASGRFTSASEVVRAALRLLLEEEERRRQAGRGDSVPRNSRLHPDMSLPAKRLARPPERK